MLILSGSRADAGFFNWGGGQPMRGHICQVTEGHASVTVTVDIENFGLEK